MTKDIKVVKIINSKQLVINAGIEDGIETGDKFKIVDKFGNDPVIDPETGESLGSLDIFKGTVVATQVYPKMSIVSAPKKTINPYSTIGAAQSAMNAAFGGFKTIRPDLNVDPTEITGGLPQPSKEPIKVGDHVVKIN